MKQILFVVVVDLAQFADIYAQDAMSYMDAVAKSWMEGCVFSDRQYHENIPAAVREDKLTGERLNDALSRMLRVRFRLGKFDPFDAVPFQQDQK